MQCDIYAELIISQNKLGQNYFVDFSF